MNDTPPSDEIVAHHKFTDAERFRLQLAALRLQRRKLADLWNVGEDAIAIRISLPDSVTIVLGDLYRDGAS